MELRPPTTHYSRPHYSLNPETQPGAQAVLDIGARLVGAVEDSEIVAGEQGGGAADHPGEAEACRPCQVAATLAARPVDAGERGRRDIVLEELGDAEGDALVG